MGTIATLWLLCSVSCGDVVVGVSCKRETGGSRLLLWRHRSSTFFAWFLQNYLAEDYFTNICNFYSDKLMSGDHWWCHLSIMEDTGLAGCQHEPASCLILTLPLSCYSSILHVSDENMLAVHLDNGSRFHFLIFRQISDGNCDLYWLGVIIYEIHVMSTNKIEQILYATYAWQMVTYRKKHRKIRKQCAYNAQKLQQIKLVRALELANLASANLLFLPNLQHMIFFVNGQ